ncbi:MAG: hypothetical protein AB7N54_15150 [Alphaproteobacteria bacterium]
MVDDRLLAPSDAAAADQANRILLVRVVIVASLAGVVASSSSARQLPVFALIMWLCAGVNFLRCIFGGMRLDRDRLVAFDVAAIYLFLALAAEILVSLFAASAQTAGSSLPS